jgi:hypothetical protein
MSRAGSNRPIAAGVLLLLPLLTPALSAAAELPLVDGKPVVAAVNDDRIFLAEIEAELAVMHAALEQHQTGVVAKKDPGALLERLINSRLIVQEAERIGLAELPEVVRTLGVQERDALRAALYRRHAEGIKQPNAAKVDQIYKQEVKRYRLKSVLIEERAVADELAARIAAGKSLETAAAELSAAGKLKQPVDEQTAAPAKMVATIRQAVEKLSPGATTPVLEVGPSFTLVKLIGYVYPDEPEVRARVADQVLEQQRAQALDTYLAGLRTQYTTIDRKLLGGVDFEANSPGFETLLRDKRIVATVKAGDSVTIGELAEAMKKKYFHGVDQAIAKKKLNANKLLMLEDILSRRVVLVEARRLKLDQTPGYRAELRDQRDGLLFGAFVTKVIDPSLKLEESEVKAYREQHLEEFSSPEMMRLDHLAFTTRPAADAATAKLRQGADIKWMRANLDGQLAPDDARHLLGPSGTAVASATLPEEIRKALAGVKAGDVRTWGGSEPPYYSLMVRELIPAATLSYDEVKQQIAIRLLEEKRRKALEEWASKLRQASTVKIYATGDKLTEILRTSMKSGK